MSSALKMGVAGSTETLVILYHTEGLHIPFTANIQYLRGHIRWFSFISRIDRYLDTISNRLQPVHIDMVGMLKCNPTYQLPNTQLTFLE